MVLGYKYLLFVGKILLEIGLVPNAAANPVFVNTGKTTYTGYFKAVDFETAVKRCQDYKGSLLFPRALQDIVNNFVYLQSMPSESWIGATDKDIEGDWRNNGSRFTFSFWVFGEPDSTSDELDCAYYSKLKNYRWSSADCETTKPFVCEGGENPNIAITESSQASTLHVHTTKHELKQTTKSSAALSIPITPINISSKEYELITTMQSTEFVSEVIDRATFSEAPRPQNLTFQTIFESLRIMLESIEDETDVYNFITTVENSVSEQLADVAFRSNFNGVLEKLFLGMHIKIVNSTDVIKISFSNRNLTSLDISLTSQNAIVVVSAYNREMKSWRNFIARQKTSKLSIDKEISLLPINGSIFHIASYEKTNGIVQKTNSAVNFTINLQGDHTVLQYLHEKKVFLQGGVFRSCALINLPTKTWEDTNCKHAVQEYGQITCSCEHTTTFSGVLSFNVISVSDDVLDLVIAIQITSTLFLSTTLVFYFVARKRLRKERSFTQIYLTLSLLFLNVVMIVAQVSNKISELCIIMTAMTHYFLMTSFCWMFNHGYILYIKTCHNPLGFNMNRYIPRLHALGWGLPGVIASVSAAIAIPNEVYVETSENYELQTSKNVSFYNFPKYRTCWLSTTSLVNLSAIVPVCLIILANCTILFKVTYVVWKLSKSSENYLPSSGCRMTPQQWDNAVKGFKAFATLSPILGCTWIFGFLVNIPDVEEVFVGFSSLLNGIQCLALLLIFAILNPDVQPTAVRRYRERSRLRRQATMSQGDTKLTNMGSRRLQTVSTTVR
ncbi:adhesion G-protein coupled receptor F1-like isoform X1 [Styela clava]